MNTKVTAYGMAYFNHYTHFGSVILSFSSFTIMETSPCEHDLTIPALILSESKIKRESPRNSLLRNQNLCFGSKKK